MRVIILVTSVLQHALAQNPINSTLAVRTTTQAPSSNTIDDTNTLCYRCKCPSSSSDVRTVNCQGSNLQQVPSWDLEDRGDTASLTVDFTVNVITAVTKEMFPPRQDLVQIILDRNNISFIGPYSFCQLPRLQYLSVSGNRLEYINPRAFSSCDKYQDVQLPVTVLDLSINNLHSLDEDLFDDLHDLQELYLSENMFVSFDMSTMSAFNKLHSLQKLDISRNKLKDVYDGLSTPIKSLSTLNLAMNMLRTVPSVLQYGEKLTGLNLNENPIAMITEDSFKDLNMLQVLNMSVMPELEILEERAFEPLSSLQYLRCNYNYKLKYINSEVFGTNQPPLVEVDLSENHILTLDEKTFSWWSGDNFNIQNNPLFCDCHMTWIKTKAINPELMSEIRCGSGPAEVKDKAVIELEVEQLACDVEVDTYAEDPVLAGLIIIALLSVLVVFVAIMAIMRYRTTPLARYATVHVRYSKPETENYRRM